MQLNFKSLGEGPALLVLHGLFGTLDNWQTLAKQWATHQTVYLLDARNHGRSPHTDHIDYPAMAADVLAFMDAQGLAMADLLGHSMGGKTAMEFALRYPQRVNQLVVVDIAPKAYPPGHDDVFAGLMAIDPTRLSSRQEAEAILETKVADSGVRQFLLKNLSRTPAGPFEWKMNLPVLSRDYPQILANISATGVYSGPALFIRGERSGYVAPTDEATIRQYFPQATVATVAGAGHWVHAEAPAALLALTQQFLGHSPT